MGASAKEKAIAFLCGDIVVTAMILLGVFNDLGHFGIKVIATLIIGAVGGFGGLLGKDLYKRWKDRKNKIKQS